MAPRRGDDADRDNAERVIHRQGGDGGGRTPAGGASTFRNSGEGALARGDRAPQGARRERQRGMCEWPVVVEGAGERTLAETIW